MSAGSLKEQGNSTGGRMGTPPAGERAVYTSMGNVGVQGPQVLATCPQMSSLPPLCPSHPQGAQSPERSSWCPSPFESLGWNLCHIPTHPFPSTIHHPPIHPPILPPIHPSRYPDIHPPFCPPIHPSIHSPTHLSSPIYPSNLLFNFPPSRPSPFLLLVAEVSTLTCLCPPPSLVTFRLQRSLWGLHS